MKTLLFAFSLLLLSAPTLAQSKKNKALAAASAPTESVTLRPSNTVSSYTHEISTGLTGVQFSSAKPCSKCGSASAVVLAGSYLKTMQKNLQVGAEGRILMLPDNQTVTGKSETLFDIYGIGAANLASDFANSVFIKGGLGLVSVAKADNSSYETKLGLFASAGKRFAWLPNVTYTPEIRLEKRGDIDVGFTAQLVNFSIVW